MPSASSLTVDSRFFGLFIGPSGGGKTPSACSFFKSHPGKRVKVYDFDGRIRGILNTPWIDRSLIDYEFFQPIGPKNQNGTGLAPNFQKLNNDFEVLLNDAARGQCPYGTLILDSLTTQTFAFIQDALAITHGTKSYTSDSGKKIEKEAGRFLGPMKMAGPEDYNFESTGTMQVMAFLKSLPIQNVIVTAHIIDKFGKDPTADPNNMMAPNVVVGERLSVRDKLSANIPGMFDHVFRFERRVIGNQNRVYVTFWSDLARSVYPNLPFGEVDITGKNFYEVLSGYNAPKS